MSSLKKNVFKNGVAFFFQKGVKALEQLFLVPFFISAWGTAYYGEWITLTIIPTMLALSDFGFGTASANTFVLKYASGDKQGAANVSKSGFLVITITVLVGMLISGLTILILDYYDVFSKLIIDKQSVIIAITILIFARLINFYSQLSDAYYRAARKASLSVNLLTVYSCLNLLSGMVVLLLGMKVVEFAISQLIVSIIFNFFYCVKGISVLGLKKKIKGSIDIDLIKDIMIKGLGYLMSPIWQSIYFQGTTFVVRIVLGPEVVVLFNTVRTLTRSVNQVFSIINSSVFPELQYEVGENNTKKAQKLYGVSIAAVLVVALIGSSLLFFLGPWFYEIWTDGKIAVPTLIWVFFIIGLFFSCIWWTSEIVFRAVNKPYGFTFVGLISSILSVILSYFLSSYYGVNGAAIGCVFFDVIMAIIVFPKSCKLLGLKVTNLLALGFSNFWSLLKSYKLSY